jgi:hypothetical protein
MATKMPTHRKGHRADTSSVTIWVKNDRLDKWDSFCETKGKNRSALIKDAVDEYITKHDVETRVQMEIAAAKVERNEVIEKLDLLLHERAETSKAESMPNGSNIKKLIRDLLAEKAPSGLTADRLAYFLQMSKNQLIDILVIMKESKEVLIRYNKEHEGEYYVECNE